MAYLNDLILEANFHYTLSICFFLKTYIISPTVNYFRYLGSFRRSCPDQRNQIIKIWLLFD